MTPSVPRPRSTSGSPPLQPEARVLARGFGFLEGPVWATHADSVPGLAAALPAGETQALLFNDLERGVTWWWCADRQGEFRTENGFANGSAVDANGRLLWCSHGERRVARLEPGGPVTAVATHYAGRRLNSPNDLVCAPDGRVCFTDPPYGVDPGDRELHWQGVYRAAPGGEVELLAEDFEKPNGLALRAGGDELLVADTAGGVIRRLGLAHRGPASDRGLFCRVPRPDGLRLDADGNVHVAAEDGLRVFDADGRPLQHVRLERRPANLAFGGAGGRTLFVCARDTLYAVAAQRPGLAWAARGHAR